MKAFIVYGSVFAALLMSFSFSSPVSADYAGAVKGDEEAVKRAIKKPGYSPYAGRNFPTKVFWGDTHLHTSNSLDARAFGVTLGPQNCIGNVVEENYE